MVNYRGMKQLTRDGLICHSHNIKERESQEKVFETYVPYVLKVASSISEKNTDVDTDDLINEGMIGLWKAIINFDISKGYTIFTLIKACVRNSILEYTNKAKRHSRVNSLDVPVIEGEEETVLYEIIEDERFNMDLEIETNEIIEMFDKLLSERDKNIMEDFYIKQLKYKDIAEKHKLAAAGHVGVIVQRSKNKLRKALAA